MPQKEKITNWEKAKRLTEKAGYLVWKCKHDRLDQLILEQYSASLCPKN
jgi:hypothetical protein